MPVNGTLYRADTAHVDRKDFDFHSTRGTDCFIAGMRIGIVVAHNLVEPRLDAVRIVIMSRPSMLGHST